MLAGFGLETISCFRNAGVKFLYFPKLFGNCAHTRLAGLPKVAKSRGKRGRAACRTASGGIDRLFRRAWRSIYRSMRPVGCDLVLEGVISCHNNPGNPPPPLSLRPFLFTSTNSDFIDRSPM
jgi:hypothetical protein